MVAHTCNPSNWEVEAGGSLVQGHPGLHRKTHIKTKYTCSYKENKQTTNWLKYFRLYMAKDLYSEHIKITYKSTIKSQFNKTIGTLKKSIYTWPRNTGEHA
jgi:hypothetical protein